MCRWWCRKLFFFSLHTTICTCHSIPLSISPILVHQNFISLPPVPSSTQNYKHPMKWSWAHQMPKGLATSHHIHITLLVCTCHQPLHFCHSFREGSHLAGEKNGHVTQALELHGCKFLGSPHCTQTKQMETISWMGSDGLFIAHYNITSK